MAKREYGSGSVTWLGPRKAKLRFRVDGKQHSKTIETAHKDHGGRGEAQDQLAKFIEETTAPPPAEQHSMDLLMAKYVEQCERIGKSRSTVESYEHVRKRLGDFGSIAVEQVGPQDLDAFYGSLTLAPNTIRHTHAVLSAALEQAVDWGWVTVNPARRAKPPSQAKSDKGPLAPTDVRRMVTLAELPKAMGGDEDPVLAMAIILSTITGARRGELCGLRWDDLDLEVGTVTIERQWVPGKGGQYLSEPKSEVGTRTMALGVEGVAIIERYRAIVRTLIGGEPEGWLLSPDGGQSPMRAKGLSSQIKALGERLDLKVTTHAFRKVSATQLVAAGVDVDTSARRMGHTKEVMLGHYVLGADDRSIAAADTLESRLIGQGLPLGELLKGS